MQARKKTKILNKKINNKPTKASLFSGAFSPVKHMILSTPPFSPNVLLALQERGITTLFDLQQHNIVSLFLQLKAEGLTITQRVLWQFFAVVNHIDVHALTAENKQSLAQAIQTHKPVAPLLPEAIMVTHMKHALQAAKTAAQLGEVPVGAVVVHHNNIIATSHNSCITDHAISHHAEINALTLAGETLQNYRLNECDVYVTLEPCPMCASALIQARVKRVIYAAKEPKMGAAGSIMDLFAKPLNQHTAVIGGILADESTTLLQDFFQNRR